MAYVIRRILALIPVLLVVAVTVFALVHLTPGDPASVMLGSDATVEQIEQLRARLGLDQPLPVQFARWASRAVRGDFGDSLFLERPVLTAILERAEPTLLLTTLSLSIAVILGVPAGVLSAVKRDSLFDQAVTGSALFLASIPTFWLGLNLILLVAVGWGMLPAAGYQPLSAGLWESLRHLILPALSLGFPNSALITRITRSTMLDILSEDYIRTAWAKGLSQKAVVAKHALKNALIPILTVVGLAFAILMGGAVVTETVFGIPGVGRLIVQSVLRRDYLVIQGTVLIIASLYVLINLVVDLLYMAVDPRVKY